MEIVCRNLAQNIFFVCFCTAVIWPEILPRRKGQDAYWQVGVAIATNSLFPHCDFIYLYHLRTHSATNTLTLKCTISILPQNNKQYSNENSHSKFRPQRRKQQRDTTNCNRVMKVQPKWENETSSKIKPILTLLKLFSLIMFS